MNARPDSVPGRRLDVLVSPETGRDDVNLNMPSEPGEYAGPVRGYTGDRAAVFFLLPVPEGHPDAGVRHITEPPHAFTEEDDGTLTVSPSILAVRPANEPAEPAPWHGYLERGQWRQV